MSRIVVVGLGYVGCANAIVLARCHDVAVHDLDVSRVEALVCGRSPTFDPMAPSALEETIPMVAFDNYQDAEWIVVCVPTDPKEDGTCIDTSIVESVLEEISKSGTSARVIIKSTVPIGFTKRMTERHEDLEIGFSPEFLREGSAVEDCLAPSRIVIGGNSEIAKFVDVVSPCLEVETPVVFMGTTEAEAVKMFSNAYLATRVAFFNELDTYSMQEGLDAHDVIRGVCLDERIGDGYNNPSFGFGGYCLPKDTSQLASTIKGDNLFSAVKRSNAKRTQDIADAILARSTGVIGMFGISSKIGAPGTRESSSVKLMGVLTGAGATVVVFEPTLDDQESIRGCRIVSDVEEFKRISSIIVANRNDERLSDVRRKVFSRDLFGCN